MNKMKFDDQMNINVTHVDSNSFVMVILKMTAELMYATPILYARCITFL